MAEDRQSDRTVGQARGNPGAGELVATSGRETGERTSLDPRGWNRSTAIFATIGAAATGYLAVYAYSRLSRANATGGGTAFSQNQQHATKDFSSTRAAGPEAMRDPPKSWERQDEALDESFPASDPPAVGSRVD